MQGGHSEARLSQIQTSESFCANVCGARERLDEQYVGDPGTGREAGC